MKSKAKPKPRRKTTKAKAAKARAEEVFTLRLSVDARKWLDAEARKRSLAAKKRVGPSTVAREVLEREAKAHKGDDFMTWLAAHREKWKGCLLTEEDLRTPEIDPKIDEFWRLL